MSDVVERRRLNKKDWGRLADSIVDEWGRRKSARAQLDSRWVEIDRQIRMEARGTVDHATGWVMDQIHPWMRATELPWQATALETLLADSRRLLFPPDRETFTATASVSEKDLRALDFASYIEPDPVNQVGRAIDAQGPQIFANNVVRRFLEWVHRQYAYDDQWDLLNGEAFKYGTFVGQMRRVRREVHFDTFRGVVRRETLLPVLIPLPIKNVFLDDSPARVLREGEMIQPSHIVWKRMRVDDLVLAARKGSTDPESDVGGWILAHIDGLEGDADGCVDVLEMEGDVLIPRKTGEGIYVPNVIITVATSSSKSGAAERQVIRYREQKFPFRSFIVGHYQMDDSDSAYGTSPLMKGYPLQCAGSDALGRAMAGAALAVAPPVKYDPADHWLRRVGGPIIEPGAQWPALTTPEVMGDWRIAEISALLSFLKNEYDLHTGMSAPRLGEQTKSHQTRGAVEQENTRGLVRTVDYVRSTMKGPMLSSLFMEYEMARTLGRQTIHLPDYHGFVEFEGKQLPEFVDFTLHGAGGPYEEAQKDERYFAALRTFVELEPIVRQFGGKPGNMDAIREAALRRGGVVDIDKFFDRAGTGPAAGTEVPPGMVPLAQGAGQNQAGGV